jgi:tRNA(fMet)-specific endonuclease VapC
MKYLLDTNVCIHYLNTSNVAIARRITTLGRRSVISCSIVVEELMYGAYRSARVNENLARVRLFAATFDVLPFDTKSASESGRVRAHLTDVGMKIGLFDNLIAGVALACGATLVTNNTSEFSRVPGLRIEDWQT